MQGLGGLESAPSPWSFVFFLMAKGGITSVVRAYLKERSRST